MLIKSIFKNLSWIKDKSPTNKTKIGDVLSNNVGDNVKTESGSIHKGDIINIMYDNPNAKAVKTSPLSNINRYIKDNDCEKNENCFKCGIHVRLSFSEPKDIEGMYEIKEALCPNCKDLKVEYRKITFASKLGIFGKLNKTKSTGEWKKMKTEI
ncbi:hypothetical protein M1446_05365 [Candidatus Dependentiae bacterium]|nr:hypothetical protein [Candidatus Dependentiae bacterium]